MNYDEPVPVIVASFKHEQAAERALAGLDQSKRLMDMQEAALIRRGCCHNRTRGRGRPAA